jgi:hypothetical protein
MIQGAMNSSTANRDVRDRRRFERTGGVRLTSSTFAADIDSSLSAELKLIVNLVGQVL